MAQRVTYGLLAVATLVMLFLADALIANGAHGREGALWSLLRRGSLLPMVVLFVFIGGAKEMDAMLRERGARAHVRFAFVMIAALILSPWLSAAGFLGTGAAQLEGLYWQIVWLIATAIGMGILAVRRDNTEGTLRDIAATLLLVFYFGFLGSFALQLRCGRDVPVQAGIWLLLFVVLVTKVSDIGAYFVGTLFGRHPLAPKVSPAKSIEGAFGGLAASVGLAIAIVAAIAPNGEQWGASVRGPDGLGIAAFLQMLGDSTRTAAIVRMGFFGLCVSAAGQMGDLFESCFKRDAGIKDSGKVLGPFGGILDLIDSVVFAMPVAWLFLTFF